MQIIGIDPGLTGAIAFLDSDGVVRVFDMPTVQAGKRNEVSTFLLTEIIRAELEFDATAYVERVSAMPAHGRRQGAQGMFSFGRSYGVVLGVLAALQVKTTMVTPVEWRKAVRLGSGKDASRVRAMELYPAQSDALKRVKDHGRADALLIANFGGMHVRVSDGGESVPRRARERVSR